MSGTTAVSFEGLLAPALYIVATPIGNMGDITLRALEVLRGVDLIAAEDTRHSRGLLSHFGISTPVTAYHEHSSEQVRERLLTRILSGERVALISDAGTPTISDPGYRLVKRVAEAGGRVIPIPGANAAIAALSVAGLPSDRFAFEGFLPSREEARSAQLQRLINESRTLLFYEAPHRLVATLEAMVAAFGAERSAVVARELTKLHESIQRATLAQLAERFRGGEELARGEVVIIVAGCEREVTLSQQQAERMLRELLTELPLARAARLASRLTGLERDWLYARGVAWQRGDDADQSEK